MSLEIAALSIGLLAAPQEAAKLSADDAAVLVQDGSRVARVGVAVVDHRRAWVVVPLIATAEGLRESPAKVVAPAWLYVPSPPRVDVLRGNDGSWMLAQDVQGGGSRMLEVLRYGGSLLDDEAPFETLEVLAARDDASLGESPPGRRFRQVDVVRDGAVESFGDLFAPRLVEFEGRLFIAGSSLTLEVAADPITWIAPVPPDDGNGGGGEDRGEVGRLEAVAIGQGADARFASLWGERCCVVRALAASQTLDDSAPVHVYWSRDLAEWLPSLPLDEEQPLFDYDLMADLDSLWLAGVVAETSPAGEPAYRARLWHLDARDGVWAEQPLPGSVDVSSSAARVRLLSSTLGATRPKLVLPDATGTSRMLEIPAR